MAATVVFRSVRSSVFVVYQTEFDRRTDQIGKAMCVQFRHQVDTMILYGFCTDG